MTKGRKEQQPIRDVIHSIGVAHNEAAMAKEGMTKPGGSPDAAAQAVMRLAHLAANVPGAIDALQVMHETQQKQERRP